MANEKKSGKIKSFFKGLTEKLDNKMKARAQSSCCCCKPSDSKEQKDSCCS